MITLASFNKHRGTAIPPIFHKEQSKHDALTASTSPCIWNSRKDVLIGTTDTEPDCLTFIQETENRIDAWDIDIPCRRAFMTGKESTADPLVATAVRNMLSDVEASYVRNLIKDGSWKLP